MKNFLNLRVKNFVLIKMHFIQITLSDNSIYTADISSFQNVHCYPKNESEWLAARIGESAIDIDWPCGFGIHLDQIAGLAMKQNKTA